MLRICLEASSMAPCTAAATALRAAPRPLLPLLFFPFLSDAADAAGGPLDLDAVIAC